MPYVPQRKAAVKATAQIKDADKPMSKKEEELVLFGEPENKKGKKSSAEADAKAKKLPLWKRYAYLYFFLECSVDPICFYTIYL